MARRFSCQGRRQEDGVFRRRREFPRPSMISFHRSRVHEHTVGGPHERALRTRGVGAAAIRSGSGRIRTSNDAVAADHNGAQSSMCRPSPTTGGGSPNGTPRLVLLSRRRRPGRSPGAEGCGRRADGERRHDAREDGQRRGIVAIRGQEPHNSRQQHLRRGHRDEYLGRRFCEAALGATAAAWGDVRQNVADLRNAAVVIRDRERPLVDDRRVVPAGGRREVNSGGGGRTCAV